MGALSSAEGNGAEKRRLRKKDVASERAENQEVSKSLIWLSVRTTTLRCSVFRERSRRSQ